MGKSGKQSQRHELQGGTAASGGLDEDARHDSERDASASAPSNEDLIKEIKLLRRDAKALLKRWKVKKRWRRYGLPALVRNAGLRENLLSTLLVFVLGIALAVSLGLPEGIVAENAKQNSIREANLKLLEQQQAMCLQFADAIPSAIAIMHEYKENEYKQIAIDGGHVAIASDEAEALEVRQRALLEQWRGKSNYLAVCQVVEVRFPNAANRAGALRCVLDIFTELDAAAPGDALAEFQTVCAALEHLEERSAVAGVSAGQSVRGADQNGDAAGSTDEDSRYTSVGVLRRWKHLYEEELGTALGWCSHLDELQTTPEESRSEEQRANIVEAKKHSATSMRDLLKRAADILYVETMQSIGEEIRRTEVALGLAEEG